MREVRQPGQGSDGHAGGPSRRNATPKASPSDPQRPTPAPGEDSRGPSQPGSAPDASATDPRYAAPAPGGHAGGATQPGSGPEVSSRPTPTAPDRARGVRPLGPVPDPFTLEALGLAEAPRDHPLLYPGAWPADSGLLDGDRLLPLDRLRHEDRVPVLAVGSNASPAQLRHKMAEYGITSPIPMVRTRVTGIDIGVSAHVSLLGYVSASPVDAPAAVRELFVTWLDAEQLAVIDASEGVPLPTGNYRRVWLPSPEVRIELADGTRLPGVYVYVNRHGVLHDGTGAPRTHPGQRALLTELLVGSARLRELFGVTPEEFCARARADRELCLRGTRLFKEEKLVTYSGLERHVRAQQTGSPGTGSSLSPPLM